MVKKRKNNIRKSYVSKRYNEACGNDRKINASTAYGTCGEQLSPFGGLLGLVKLLDLIVKGDAVRFLTYYIKRYENSVKRGTTVNN